MAFDYRRFLPSFDLVFVILKYTIVVSNVLIIVGSLFAMISGRDLGEPEFKNNHGAMMFVCVVVILFCSLGIFAALRRHFALMITYAVLMSIALAMEIAELSREDVGAFMASATIVTCAYAFAFMIKQYEKEEQAKRNFSHQAV